MSYCSGTSAEITGLPLAPARQAYVLLLYQRTGGDRQLWHLLSQQVTGPFFLCVILRLFTVCGALAIPYLFVQAEMGGLLGAAVFNRNQPNFRRKRLRCCDFSL